jgi:hypothetical protein
MKPLHLLIGFVAFGLLSGCAHEQTKPVSNNASQPEYQVAGRQAAPFVVVASTNGALSYQWQFDGANSIDATNR